MMRRTTFVTALVLAFVLVSATTAFAIEPGSLVAYSVRYKDGTVCLGAGAGAGIKSVRFLADGSFVATAAVDAHHNAIAPPHKLTSATTFIAQGLDATGTVKWTTKLTLDPAAYRPAKPVLNTPWRGIVPGLWTIKGTTRIPATGAVVRIPNYGTKTVAVAPAASSFTIPDVKVPVGPQSATVAARNGFGSSPSTTIPVYNLGAASTRPTASKYVLVDKFTMRLYYVTGSVVNRDYPVATGMPGTPTPNGYFKLGHQQASSGVWGPLRRPIYRYSGSTLIRSGYYIHGTNDPSSIGTQASHGCVRMYNSHVRDFATRVADNTIVYIR